MLCPTTPLRPNNLRLGLNQPAKTLVVASFYPSLVSPLLPQWCAAVAKLSKGKELRRIYNIEIGSSAITLSTFGVFQPNSSVDIAFTCNHLLVYLYSVLYLKFEPNSSVDIAFICNYLLVYLTYSVLYLVFLLILLLILFLYFLIDAVL